MPSLYSLRDVVASNLPRTPGLQGGFLYVFLLNGPFHQNERPGGSSAEPFYEKGPKSSHPQASLYPFESSVVKIWSLLA